ncbi:unnamed protein product [Menidia menidia]|uniref:(Atlantic silverside) hypothetical protein n=1 Tax=Menidia menidia TaxID=238744 RepID=A0A8S4B7F9_9TELE|nr:unnamed protein product [Menidia menidia]
MLSLFKMFLTVYLSNDDQHFTEVPIMPETLCRDVVELCREPGEADCYLAETWRGSEYVIGEGEQMLEVLQRWGHQRGEVRYILRHQRPPGRESGRKRPPTITESPPKGHAFIHGFMDGSRAADQMMKMKDSAERCLENGFSAPRLDVTLGELQDLAARQQQQITVQQQLLATKPRVFGKG